MLWHFRPFNNLAELQGNNVPWTIHNVLKGDAWGVDSVDRGDAYFTGLLPIYIAGDLTTVWKVQVPIGKSDRTSCYEEVLRGGCSGASIYEDSDVLLLAPGALNVTSGGLSCHHELVQP